tara:strand:- start:28804 stop:29469 length:666 start_codon:yes stop_codon:yes gene_type:complete
MKKAIVLLSGGQDSTTCLYWALRNFKKVLAIGFDYGQKHLKEIECAKKICKDVGVPYELINIKELLGNSALTNHNQDINSNHKDLEHLPASFVPARNALFLTVATTYAFNNGIKNIITGTCQTDYSGYPDCRQVFINSLSVSLSLALDTDIKIHTPLMYLDKAQTWKLAKDLDCLDVIIKDTMTDYNGSQKMNEWGRGELDNPASELRAKGYYKAKENGWL